MNKDTSTVKKMWLGLAVLAVLSPVGVILPNGLNAGPAWGEWGLEELGNMLGFVPWGMKNLSGLWNAPLPDYSFQGWAEKGLAMNSLAYMCTAVVGVTVVAVVAALLGKAVVKNQE